MGSARHEERVHLEASRVQASSERFLALDQVAVVFAVHDEHAQLHGRRGCLLLLVMMMLLLRGHGRQGGRLMEGARNHDRLGR